MPAPTDTPSTSDRFAKVLEQRTAEPQARDTSAPAPGDAPEPPADAPQDEGKAAKTDEQQQQQAPQDAELPDSELESAHLLTKEEIDEKFPNSNKTLRTLVAKGNTRLREITAALAPVGGIEGAKDLGLKLATLRDPAKVDEAATMFKELSPAAHAKVQSDGFWAAIDDKEHGLENIQALVDDKVGKMPDGSPVLTVEDIELIAEAKLAGDLDLETLKARQLARMSPEERERQTARDQELNRLREKAKADEKTAADQKAEKERAERETRQANVLKTKQEFGRACRERWEPEARNLGLLPLDGDPDEVREFKDEMLGRILRQIESELAGDPDEMKGREGYKAGDADFVALLGLVEEQKLDDPMLPYFKAPVLNKVKTRFRELARQKAPIVAGFVKNYQPGTAQSRTPAPRTAPPPPQQPSTRTTNAPPVRDADKPAYDHKAAFSRTVAGRAAAGERQGR